MNASSPHPDPQLPELESALALLAAAQPRTGLEQRVLARLASAPAVPAWYQRLTPAPWLLATASAAVVATAVTWNMQRHTGANIAPAPHAAISAPRPVQQPVAAASSFAVPDHPLQHGSLRARHRGVHRTYRAEHPRTILPPGTAAPMHPQLQNAQP